MPQLCQKHLNNFSIYTSQTKPISKWFKKMPTEHAQQAFHTPYKCMYSSSLSDLKKSTAVDESLSKTSTRCSVPENTNQLQDTLIKPVDLKNILNSVQKVIPQQLGLSQNPSTSIGLSMTSCQSTQWVFNDTLVISILAPLVDTTFHIHLYEVHRFLMVSTMPHKTLQNT